MQTSINIEDDIQKSIEFVIQYYNDEGSLGDKEIFMQKYLEFVQEKIKNQDKINHILTVSLDFLNHVIKEN